MNSRNNLQKYATADVNEIYNMMHHSVNNCNEKSILRYEKNELKDTKHDTILYRLKRAFVNPFTIVLFILAIISASTDILLSKNCYNSGDCYEYCVLEYEA